MDTNVVYAAGVTKIDNEQLTKWLGGEDDVVPPAVLDCVLTVPIGRDGPGSMQEGPAQATAGNVSCNQDEVVFATEPEVKDFNDDETDVSSRVAIMLQKLEELEAAGARSVAVEMASLMEEDAVLLDHLGRRRIQKICDEIQETCRKLSTQEMCRKLEVELRDAVMGKSRWLLPVRRILQQRARRHMKRNTSWLLVTRNRLVSLTGRFGAWPNLVSGGMVTLRICLTAKNLCRQQNGRRACCGERMWAVELQLCFFACG